jgi:hypothetical protein
MPDMYFKLVKAGKRQMEPGGALAQVPEKYLVEVQVMLDAQVIV